MSEPFVAVAETLDAVLTAPLSEYTIGTNLFQGHVRPQGDFVPHAAIFCAQYGAMEKRDTFGGGGYTPYLVQVTVRGDVDDYEGTLETAMACRQALHHASVPGYMRCKVNNGPNFIGLDNTEHPVFTINLELWREE